MSIEAWAIVASIALALVGYVVTFLLQRHQAQRQAELERVNLQLRNLYGPLYATFRANQAIWDAFCQKFWPAHGQATYFGSGETTEEENERWRTWMLEVFEPLNCRVERAILENGDLLYDNELPQEFVDVLSHIASYRALYPKWKKGDFTEHVGVLNYPAGLLQIVEPAYHKLLQRQRELSGQS
ncbi:MAG: hypothetical protein NXI32_06675 [bacterium]|nr:hypothetical protein [bacterium]